MQTLVPMRAVAFLDILGFSDLVQREDLATVKQRFALALQSLQLAQAGATPQPGKPLKPFHCFSFSDTFVLAAADNSLEANAAFVIGSALLIQYLFAQGLPVRGALTYGEADFIPGTNHLIGKAIVTAHALEKNQNWLGVLVDWNSFPLEAQATFMVPVFAPLYTRWDVPMKDAQPLKNTLVVNWRFNLVVEKGTRSLFHPTQDPRAQRKIENTLAFAKHIRDNNQHAGHAIDNNGNRMKIPWLAGCAVGSKEPGTFEHGDEL